MTSTRLYIRLFDLPRRRLLKKGLKASIAIYATVGVCICECECGGGMRAETDALRFLSGKLDSKKMIHDLIQYLVLLPGSWLALCI